MKPTQKNSGASEKKSRTTSAVVLGAAATPAVQAKAQTAFDAPSEKVWSRYIDSRMKQFGTR